MYYMSSLQSEKVGRCDFVYTTRYLEKIALDLIEFRDKKKYVLVLIDYHSSTSINVCIK